MVPIMPARTSSSSVSSSSHQPQPLRLNPIGNNPKDIVGKVLKRVRRSNNHPTVALDFSDETTFRVLVDGYDPVHRGIPKDLEMDFPLDELLSSSQPLNLQVLDCALISLSDKAFSRKCNYDPNELQWDQRHLGVAIKLSEETPRWHCIWAIMEEYDNPQGTCVFRSYDDVYLEEFKRSNNKQPRRKSNAWR